MDMKATKTNFDPRAWRRVGLIDLHRDGADDSATRAAYAEHGAHTHGGAGQCDLCGAHYTMGVVYQPKAAFGGRMISVGWQCAEKYGFNPDPAERRRAMAQRKAVGERRARGRAFRAWARDMRAQGRADVLKALHCDHKVSRDLRRSAIRWAGLTEPQEQLALKIAAQCAAQAADQDKAIQAPITEGKRQEVMGTVVGVKTVHGDYGSTIKMTVRVEDDQGRWWLAWGTAPDALLSALHDARGQLRGSVVAFTAAFTQGSEPHFTFFRRPTKARLMAPGGREA